MPKWLELRTATTPTSWSRALAMARRMATLPATWPMPLLPSTSAVVAPSRSIVGVAAASSTPASISRTYCGRRATPWLSMPRASLATSTVAATPAPSVAMPAPRRIAAV